MPKNIEDSVVMRIVVRQGFSRDMADMLLGDIRAAIAEFEKLEYPTPSRMACQKQQSVPTSLFTHTGVKRK
jgi:glutamate decarboxylase